VSDDIPSFDEPPVTVATPSDRRGPDTREPAGEPTAAGDAESGPEGEDDDADQVETEGLRQARRRAHRRRNTVEWVVVLASALVIALVIKTFLFQAFFIPSDSMVPTLKVGDRVLVNKLSYRVHDVHDGDVIVFDRPSTEAQTVEGCDGGQVTFPRSQLSGSEVHDLIKRVIATEGQTVEQRDGKIFVNGQAIDETYLFKDDKGVAEPSPAFKSSSQCIKVPAGKVFVLGDHRQDSAASNVFGPIPDSTIVGRAFMRVWPPGDIGGL
jgi:signal peptidase I